MSCPICSEKSVEEKFVIPDNEYGLTYKATYAACGNCGCLYQSPMPTSEQLGAFYPAAYHSMHSQGLIAKIKNHLRLRTFKKRLSAKDTFLDFGCGNGSFILFASEHCKDVQFYGYEIDSTNHTETHKEGRVVIIKGSLEYLKDHLPPCNIISLHHVIEHLPDPKKTLTFLHGKLVPKGWMMGQTPACDSLERKIFKNKWSGFHAPRHTVVFSRKGLKKTFVDTGFSDISINAGINPAGIAVSIASLFNDENGGTIRRAGPQWIFLVLASSLFIPIDLLIRGSIIDFYAKKL